MSEAKAPNTIGPVHHTAAYELVVDQIRRVIYLGRYLPGDKLPPERELAQQLGVSRTTVREAVRLLEGERLITVKRGATGGIIVTTPHGRTLNEWRTISDAHKRELEEIFEYRFAVECFAVRLAAEKRTNRDITLLRNAMETMEKLATNPKQNGASIAEFNAADAKFHIGIAAASKNRHLLRAVEEIRAAMFLPVGSIFEKLTDEVDVHHRLIVDAVAEQDADAAEKHMHEHIQVAFDGLKTLLSGRNAARRARQA